MRTRYRRGITLIEVLVILLLLFILVGLLVPALTTNRYTYGRLAMCQNNLRNIGLALANFQASRNRFPTAGTFYDDPAIHQGEPYKSNIYQAIADPGTWAGESDSWLRSWVIEILPLLDFQDMYNSWNFQEPYLSTVSSGPSQPSNARIASITIDILRCPDDFTAQPNAGNLSYVVNGGFARWHAIPVGWSGGETDGKPTNGGELQWAPSGSTWRVNQAIGKKLGVMFLGTHTGDQPWDLATTPADISDGAANTLLVAENTLVGYSEGTTYSGGWATNWACPLPNFTMFLGSDNVCRTDRSPTDCRGGQLRRGPKGETGKGWARANQAGTFEDVNFGRRLTVEGSFPFANSPHDPCDGSNFVFCDGAVRFLSRTIDGMVYARLITPAGSRLPPEIRQGPLSDEDLPQYSDCDPPRHR